MTRLGTGISQLMFGFWHGFLEALVIEPRKEKGSLGCFGYLFSKYGSFVSKYRGACFEMLTKQTPFVSMQLTPP